MEIKPEAFVHNSILKILANFMYRTVSYWKRIDMRQCLKKRRGALEQLFCCRCYDMAS